MLKRLPARARRQTDGPSFSETLRYLIVGRIHAGILGPGDRLPSIRDLANRSEVDHRAAAAAYRALEQDGLVEVRKRSGVYVAASFGSALEHASGGAWAADILFQGWQTGISRSALCQLFGGMLPSPLRCGCIESNADHMVALTSEVENALSLEVVPVLVDPSADESDPPAEDLADVDVIVTSVLHARHARDLSERLGKPLAVLTLRREYSAEIARRLSDGPVTVIAVDPEYSRLAREYFSAIGYAVQVRFISPEQARLEGIDPDARSVLATRAARRRLGVDDYHLVPGPMSSEESARALCEVVAAAAPRRRPRLRLEPDGQGLAPPIRNRPALTRRGAEGGDDTMDLEAITAEVERALRTDGLFAALRALNRTTPYRFTGIYRFEPDWVRSVVLFDRENPHLRVGADVPMKESYCVLTADDGGGFRIENALTDPRLTGHKARAAVLCYCATHLVDSQGNSWGTLCHYDFRPAEIRDGTLEVLKAVQPLIQRALGPAAPHVRMLPNCAR